MALPAAEVQRIRRILRRLAAAYPEATTALHYREPFELLCATILSAQCTDEMVNRITPDLFSRFPDAHALAAAPVGEVETLIKSSGFFRQKTKSLIGMSQELVARFNGEVPREIDELVTLPGVARKTANVVLGTAFGIAAGVVVDTHVRRLSQRLGLSVHHDPVKIERDLMARVPQSRWVELSHSLILHGRQVCNARRPRCSDCTLASDCPSRNDGDG